MQGQNLIQLAYISKVSPNISEVAVKAILDAAARNNPQIGITGLLIWRHNQFFQLLEGPEQAIDILMRYIREDKRHSDVLVLHRKPIEKRSFGNWSMDYVASEKELGEKFHFLEAVMAAPNAPGLDNDAPLADLVESFRRGYWDVA